MILITFAVDIKDLSEAQKSRDDVDASMSSVVYTIVVLLVVLLLAKFLSDLIFVYAVFKVLTLNNIVELWTLFLE